MPGRQPMHVRQVPARVMVVMVTMMTGHAALRGRW
jgi:hypothetical protein